tara:strand:- start:662 stop:1222 length:561 start_codon:yes stop_codon:yes gene_type:complete
MPILEENFNDNQLALIESGVQENIFEDGIFDEEKGDYVRVNIFDDRDDYVASLQSNKPKKPDEAYNQGNFDLSPQVQLYRDSISHKIFIKPNEILEHLQLEDAEGNYTLKFDFLRNTILALQGCTDDRPQDLEQGFFDIYGNHSCGPQANEPCLAQNYNPDAGAPDGSCTYPGGVIPGTEEEIVEN